MLITGATHGRELISTSLTMFQILKLLKKGVIENQSPYVDYLKKNKLYFIPVINVDALALIE